MKKFTHGLLSLLAIKRLEKATIAPEDLPHAQSLLKWFRNYRDDVLKGSWYPDEVIKDMATSHVLKYEPDTNSTEKRFKSLPGEYHLAIIGSQSNLLNQPYTIKSGNLPDRCEAITHSIVDNLKMQRREEKGSPISPTCNHIASLFFMLSHYIADSHMPLHCDARSFSENDDIHGHIEKEWDDIVRRCYRIDKDNDRFYYDTEGYPFKQKNDPVIDWIEDQLIKRPFSKSYGTSKNTWDFMSAITQHSYLVSYQMIPGIYDENLAWNDFKCLNTGYSFNDYSKFILVDSVDSIARVWLRIWCRYQAWLKN